MAWKEGKALQAKERLQEDWREGCKALQAKERLVEGWRATTTRFGAVMMMMMMMINGAPNSHSTPQEAIKTLLLKERLLEGYRKGAGVLVGGLAMVNGVKESRA